MYCGVATAAHVLDECPRDLKFHSCFEECHLTQLVTFPTYRNSGFVAPKSTFDLVITDDPDRVFQLTETEPLGHTPMGQSHCLIMGSMAIASQDDATTITTPHPRHIWSRADYNALSDFITSTDWVALFSGHSTNDNYNLLLDKYREAVQKHIPSTTTAFITKEELWITPEVLTAVREKHQLWCKYIAAGRHTHEAIRKEHKRASKNVAKLVKAAVQSYEEEITQASRTDPKNFTLMYAASSGFMILSVA